MSNDLEVVIKARAALETAQKEISTFLKGIEDGSDGAGRKASMSFGDMTKAVTVTAGAITALAAGVGMLGSRGADVADLRTSFEQLNDAIGNDSVTVLKALNDGFLGGVSNATLMKIANEALGAGLKPNREEFRLLADAAKILSDRTGQDATQAFEMLTDALVTGRTKGVEAKLGVIDNTKALEAYAAQVGTTKDKLTEHEKVQATAIATMEMLQRLVHDNGRAQEDFGDKVQQSKARVENFIDSIGEWIAQREGLGSLASAITAVAGGFTIVSASAGPVTAAVTKLGPLVSGPLLAAFTSLGTVITGSIVPLFATTIPAAFAALTPFLLPAGLVVGGIIGIYEAWKHWDAIVAFFKGSWQFVVDEVSRVPDWLLPLTGPIGMVMLAFRHWDEITGIAKNVYDGVKTWLVDKFGSIISSIAGGIDKVSGFFEKLSDHLVGHSVVPEMVNGISLHFDRMQANMGDSAERAKDKVEAHFKKIAELRDQLFGLDQLPKVTATIEAIGGLAGVARLDADGVKSLHEQMVKAIDVAERMGKVVPDQWRAIAAATFDTAGALDAYGARMQALVDNTKQVLGQQFAGLNRTMTPVLVQTLDRGWSDALAQATPGIVTKAQGIGSLMGLHMGSSAMEGLKGGLSQIGSTLLATLEGGGNSIKAIAGTMGQSFSQHLFGSDAFKGLITKHFGDAIGGMFNAFLPGIGALAGPLITKIGSLFANLFHFGGPSAAEKQGRSVWDEFVDSMRQAETEADRLEAAQNVAKGATVDWADAATTLKNKYIALGRSGDEALSDIARMQAATREGGDAVAAVVADINKKLAQDMPTAAAAAQQALGNAATDSELRLGTLNDRIEQLQVQMHQPVSLGLDITDAQMKLALLAAQKSSFDAAMAAYGGRGDDSESHNNSQGVMSFEEFIRRNPGDAHRYAAAVLGDNDNSMGDLRGAASGGLFDRPVMRVIAESGPEVVGSPNAIVDAFTKALRQVGGSGGGGQTGSAPIYLTVKIGDDTLEERVIDAANTGLANGRVRVPRRALVDRG